MNAPLETSVVVASFGEEGQLERCLASIQNGEVVPAEIVVASDRASGELGRVRARFPEVKFVLADDPSRHSRGTSNAGVRETRVFRLRTLGVEAASGRVVALLEDHCVVGRRWLAALSEAHEVEAVIAGGPVSMDADRGVRAWAIFWCEYAALLPPLPADGVSYLSAVNASYSGDQLRSCYAVWREGFYDNEVHDALQRAGCGLRVVDDAAVETSLSFSFVGALAHLFTGGRRYGRYQRLDKNAASRGLRILLTPAIPAVLLVRIFRIAAARRPDRLASVILGLPFILCFLGAWAAGELAGSLGAGAGAGAEAEVEGEQG
jgi:glycosyltransferase involved in cell wall biosynthesis